MIVNCVSPDNKDLRTGVPIEAKTTLERRKNATTKLNQVPKEYDLKQSVKHSKKDFIKERNG